jgi:thiopeptide-type bacteriocin biosynthesis protein
MKKNCMEEIKIQRIFLPGEEWVYYKIYCGIRTSDDILTSCIAPLVEEFKRRKWISKWFFIRYTDSHNHLRVRFLLSNNAYFGKITRYFLVQIQPYVKNKQVWDVQLGTYKRELERYGSYTMEIIETVFFQDSEYLLSVISVTDNDVERFTEVFQYIEEVISYFHFTSDQKLVYLNTLLNNYQQEFKIGSKAKKRLSTRYRQVKENLNLETKKNIPSELHIVIKKLLLLHQNNKLENSLEDLLASCIHMTVNRMFTSNQRLYELLLYDFLYRKNRTLYYKNGNH